MFISRQKKQENIVEYVLYMWQIEDLVRAYKFDIEAIDKNIISQFNYSDQEKKQMREWYESLIKTMRLEKVMEKGHFQALKNLIFDLNDLHLFLERSPLHPDYQQKAKNAQAHILEYQIKSQNKTKTIIEVCLEAMYGVLMLRLKKAEITPETQKSVEAIGQMLALLAKKYHQRDKDELDF